MSNTKFTRRTFLKTSAATAASAYAGVQLMLPRRAHAQREQKLVYWHQPTFTPLADEAAREMFEEFRQQAGLKDNEAAFVTVASQDFAARLAADTRRPVR